MRMRSWREERLLLEEMAQVVTEGYIPSEQLKRRLELMGVTYGDCITVQDKGFTPVDDRVRGWARVGREEEGTSSYRAELAALLMLLRRVHIDADIAVLLDCKSEITEIGKWPGAREPRWREWPMRIFSHRSLRW